MVHEEIRQNARDGTSSKSEDEEKNALTGKEKKGKVKKSKSKPASSQGGNKTKFSKVKFFHCHEFRNYATKCPHKKETRRPQKED